MEEAQERHPDNPKLAEEEAGTHFLGAVVIQQIPTITSELDRRDIIDGQQRMTTLQILLDAAQEILEELELTMPAKRLSKLVLNDEDFAVGDDRFKLWPTANDRDAFRAAMTNGYDTTDFSDSLIVQAHDYFRDQIRHWITSTEVFSMRAENLVSVLSGLLELVVIDLEDKDDSYVIFETLNARGTPLLASDLIKNYLLQVAARRGLDPDLIHDEHWSKFETAWWRKEVTQGRLRRPRVDVMINYWLIRELIREVPSQQVFPSFRKLVDSSDSPIGDIAGALSNCGDTFASFESYDSFSSEGTFFYRWGVMQAGVITPVLLDIMSVNSTVSESQKKRALEALESYLIRRTACRMTTKDYNRLTVDLLEFLSVRDEGIGDLIVEFLGSQKSESRLWPDDARFRDALSELPLYRLLTRGRLRVILEGIEEEMRSSKAEEQNVPRGALTMEHIMPQNWAAHWPMEVYEDQEQNLRAVSKRDRLVHSLGNITLVSEILNPSLSNGSWTKKQAGLAEHSTLYLNKQLLSRWGDGQFNEESIAERGRELSAIACRVWTGPRRN